MSVQRYDFVNGVGDPSDGSRLETPFGRYVLHIDYAALEARSAGLERDALKLSLDEVHSDSEERRKEASQWQQWCVEARQERDAAVADRDGYMGAIEKMASERDTLQAKLAAAEEALRLARERQGKRLEWIWDGLRAICAMDPSTEAERMQQWASDTLYGAATPTEWEPDVRALRMEEFKKRPPIAGHAPATKGEGDE